MYIIYSKLDKQSIFRYNLVYSRVLYFVWIKMNMNTAGVAEDRQVSIEDALKNSWDLSTRSNEDLIWFLDEYTKEQKYWAMAALATELDSRSKKEMVDVDSDVQKKLAEDQLKQEASNKEFNSKLEEEKQQTNIANENKVAELTTQLNNADEKILSLEETVNKLLEAQKENRENTSQSLEDILNSKNSGDSETVNKLLEEIKKLNQDKKTLETKSKEEILKYPQDQIATMKTKLIKWRWISRKTIKTADGKETIIKRPSIKINRHRRSRRKLNQVVKAFNGFKKDSDSAVKYILTQERSDRADTITWINSLIQLWNRWRYNLLRKRWFVMSESDFEEKFDKQKKKIIDKFKNNIKPEKDTAEDKTIKALEARMSRYKQDYMNKHY